MITFHCECGQKLKVDDKYSGKKIRCPKCKAVSQVPPDGDLSDVVSSSAVTHKMRSPDSEEYDFKTLPKLKSLDDLVDIEDEEENDVPPPTRSKLPMIFGVICSLIGLSAAIAFGVVFLPQAVEMANRIAEEDRARPPEGVEIPPVQNEKGADGGPAENPP